MMFFDLCYLITGISLITVGLTNTGFYSKKEQMIVLGGAFGIGASISALCNSLATHGLRSWRRGFLLPWLIYYLIILCALVMVLARFFYYEPLNLKQVFLFMICLCLFSCWRHLQKQFLLMAYPRPEQVVVDVEAVVRDLISQTGLRRSSQGAGTSTGYETSTDLPPKYEEVEEDLPPQYDPTTMVPAQVDSSTSSTAEGAVGGQPSTAAQPVNTGAHVDPSPNSRSNN